MTRTIYVVFPGDSSFYRPSKRYAFLCNYDCVRKGDKIIDPRYSSSMEIVDITPCTDRVQNGITLKDIYITMINDKLIYQPSGLTNGSITGSDFDIDKQKANNMERNLKVTLEQAIEWYNSGNETLRTLALTAYTEEELTLNINYIRNTVSCDCVCINVPLMGSTKTRALADLAVIAKYFNGSWKKTPSNTGYFLGQSNLKFSNSTNIEIKGLRNIGICTHNTVMYPGIVYFKDPEDIIKALKIMGDKARDLFN